MLVLSELCQIQLQEYNKAAQSIRKETTRLKVFIFKNLNIQVTF